MSAMNINTNTNNSLGKQKGGLSTEAENGHGIFFFYALLSRDNDLLSGYLDITKVFSCENKLIYFVMSI